MKMGQDNVYSFTFLIQIVLCPWLSFCNINNWLRRMLKPEHSYPTEEN